MPLRKNTHCVAAGTHTERPSATAPTQRSASMAAKLPHARPIRRRQPIRRTCSCPSGCEAPVRGRPVLRPEWQRMEPGRAHRRSANSRDVSPPGASLPCGSSRRLRTGRRNNHRGEFARLNRSDRRPGGRLQRADLAARRHLTDVGGRLSLRSPQSHDDLPLWRVEEQAVLRWQSRVD